MASKNNLKVLVPTIIYLIATFVMVSLKDSMAGDPAYYLVTLAPSIPAIFMIRAAFKQVMAEDEMQRRIHLEAVFISAITTSMVTMTLFNLSYAGFPKVDMVWVFAMIAVFYTIAVPFRHRAYQ